MKTKGSWTTSTAAAKFRLLASEGFMHSAHPSRGLYSFKQWKTIKEVQRPREIQWSTCACCQAELHWDELHGSLDRIHSPPTGNTFKLEHHMLDGPTSRQMPFLVSTAQEALQLIWKKYLGFLYCLKLWVFSVQQCHSSKSLLPHTQWEACKKWPLLHHLPFPTQAPSSLLFWGRGKHLRNTFQSSLQSL